ncbi:MAG: hypothetical protein RMI56_02590 [Sulfolobales archaeon]|nr:hypothetical protein [Sulfolobales archaeon]
MSTFRTLDPLVEVLAFYAAMRNYGYIDRLSNALNEVAVYEALNDILRDYYSQCVDREDKCVEVSANVKYRCPTFDARALEDAIVKFMERVRGQPGYVLVRETRELALAAYARKPKALESRC